MNVKRDFFYAKKRAINSFEKAHSEKKIDQKILSILNIINKSSVYFTTSSCSGRIVLLEIPRFGDKKNAKFLGKWHKTIEFDEILSSLISANKGQIWLLAQSSIIHVVAADLQAADKIIKIANTSGFKNSGIKSINRKIICEICSTERLDTPIGSNKVLLCDKDFLIFLVNIANEIIEKSNKKLLRFEQILKKYLSTNKTTN
jgi:tRNA wybutosine-synthesizing protein 3